MTRPLVSIVTPTMPGREELLISRCLPSVDRMARVCRQHNVDVEHVIVSDPNPDLAAVQDTVLAAANLTSRVRFAEINDHWRDGVRDKSIGAIPWMVGSMMALGDLVGFLGDDDELLPDHAIRHQAAMDDTGADFSISVIEFRVRGEFYRNIGDSFAHGHLDSTGIMCRRSALRVANWTATGEDAADHRLVTDWLRAGLRGTLLGGAPTGIHHDGWAAR